MFNYDDDDDEEQVVYPSMNPDREGGLKPKVDTT